MPQSLASTSSSKTAPTPSSQQQKDGRPVPVAWPCDEWGFTPQMVAEGNYKWDFFALYIDMLDNHKEVTLRELAESTVYSWRGGYLFKAAQRWIFVHSNQTQWYLDDARRELCECDIAPRGWTSRDPRKILHAHSLLGQTTDKCFEVCAGGEKRVMRFDLDAIYPPLACSIDEFVDTTGIARVVIDEGTLHQDIVSLDGGVAANVADSSPVDITKILVIDGGDRREVQLFTYMGGSLFGVATGVEQGLCEQAKTWLFLCSSKVVWRRYDCGDHSVSLACRGWCSANPYAVVTEAKSYVDDGGVSARDMANCSPMSFISTCVRGFGDSDSY